MKRILYISHADLYARTGGGLASLCYLNALKIIFGKEIDIIAPDESLNKIDDKSYNHIGIPRRSKIKGLISILKGELHRFYPAIKTFIDTNYQKYDICVINGGMYAGDMIDFIQDKNIKVVVIHHNYEPEYHKDNKTAPSFYGLSTYYVVRNELNAYVKADLNLFITNSDLLRFQKEYGNITVPCGVLGVFEPSLSELPVVGANDFNNVISITGCLNTPQTVLGIKDFVDNYLDLVLERLPNSSILIAGREPTNYITNLNKLYPMINVIPNPLSMDEIIRSSSLFLCPTYLGGGLKLRLMDGLRNGLPVLCHEKSVRGYEEMQGHRFFQAYKDRTSFSKVFNLLIENMEKGRYDRQSIQDEYLKYFSFDAGVKRMATFFSYLR